MSDTSLIDQDVDPTELVEEPVVEEEPQNPETPDPAEIPAGDVSSGISGLFDYREKMAAAQRLADSLSADGEEQWGVTYDPSAPRTGDIEGVRVVRVPRWTDEPPEGWDAYRQSDEANKQANEAVSGAVSDVAGGAMGYGMEALGGVRDAFQELHETSRDLGQWIGNRLREVTGKEPVGDPMKLLFSLPEIEGTDTATGTLIRKAAQFLTGYAVGSSALSVMGWAPGVAGTAASIGRSALLGAINDLAWFDAQEPNMFNLMQSFGVENDFVDYMATSPEDGMAEAKFKNALTGAGFGILVDVTLAAVRSMRAAKIAKANLAPAIGEAVTDEAAKQAQTIRAALTSDDAPRVFMDAGDAVSYLSKKLKSSINAVDTRSVPVPDEVFAKSITEGINSPNSGLIQFGNTIVNLDRFGAEDSVRSFIGDLAEITQRQGEKFAPQTWETIEAGTRAALSEGDESVWQIIIEGGRNTKIYNAQQLDILRNFLATITTEAQDTAYRAVTTGSPDSMLRARKLTAVGELILGEIRGSGTEIARALNIFRKMTKPRGDLVALTNTMDLIDDLGGLDVNREFAKKLFDKIANEGMGGFASAATKGGAGSRTMSMLQEAFYGNLLSGLSTDVRNIAGSTSHIALDLADTTVANRVARILGDDAAADQIGTATMKINGLLRSSKQAAINAYDALISGESSFGGYGKFSPTDRNIAVSRGSSLLEWAGERSKLNPLRYLADVYGYIGLGSRRLLVAEDDVFKTLSYGAEIDHLANAKVAKEVASGITPRADWSKRLAELIANPTEDMAKGAYDYAHRTVFEMEPGKFIKWIEKGRRDMPGLRFLLPFVRIVGNVTRIGAEHSPLAPFLGAVKDDLAAGGARAYMAQARIVVGTTLLSTFYELALQGKITGALLGSRNVKSGWRRSGMQEPFSLKIGDKWVSYRGMAPISDLIAYGAQIAEMVKDVDWQTDNAQAWAEIGEVINESLLKAVNIALDKTMLTGLTGAIAAIEDPDRYGDNYINSFVGSLVVPNIFRMAARSIDPVQRIEEVPGAGFLSGALGKIVASIPGARNQLEIKYDAFGRPEKRGSEFTENEALNFFFDMVSPVYIRQADPEPIDEATMKDGWAVPDITPNISRKLYEGPGRANTVRLKNSPMEYSRLGQLQGIRPSEIAEPPTMTFTHDQIEVLSGDTFTVPYENSPTGRVTIRLANANAPSMEERDADGNVITSEKGQTSAEKLDLMLRLGPIVVQPFEIGSGGDLISEVRLDTDLSPILNAPERKWRPAPEWAEVDLNTVDNLMVALHQASLYQKKRLGYAKTLLTKYGDRTMLETLNAVVGDELPEDGPDLIDAHTAWHDAEDADAREKIIRDVVDDYRSTFKELLILEFPWIERQLRQKPPRRLYDEPEEFGQ